MTIDELKDYLDGRFVDVDRRFTELRDYTDERTRNMETHVLSEFRKWACASKARYACNLRR
jgi:hypothetical protein